MVLRSLLLGLCLTLTAHAQLELTTSEARALIESVEERAQLFESRARQIETLGRELNDIDLMQMRWYYERVEMLWAGKEVLEMVVGFDYDPTGQDLRVWRQAAEILEGPDRAPRFAHGDLRPGGHELDEELLRQIREGVEPEPVPAQPRELDDAQRQQLKRLEMLRSNGLITEFEYLSERLTIVPSLEDIDRLLQILAATFENGLISAQEFNQQVAELKDLRTRLEAPNSPSVRELERQLSQLEIREQLARLRLREVELEAELARTRLTMLKLRQSLDD